MKFWTKESFSHRNSGKLCYTPWKCHIFLSLLDILHPHTVSAVFIVNFVNISCVFLSVSIVNTEQVIACNGESHVTLTKYFGVSLPHGQCFFLLTGLCINSIWSKTNTVYSDFYNETHLSLVETHLFLFFNILLIHTFLITLDCKRNGGLGGGEGIGISTYLISRGEGWEKLKLKYFLRNAKKVEKVMDVYLAFKSRFFCPKLNWTTKA